MRRREFLVGLAGASALAGSRAASAQASSTVPLIAMLAPLSPALAAQQIRAFRSELRELGYVEGRNVELDIRYAEGATARIPQLAAELIARKPAVLLAFSTAAVQAASAATKTIPLVIATLEDPVAQGLVKSIARPGTNVTGTWMAGDEGMIGKRLALLKDIVPGLVRLGAVVNPADTTDAIFYKGLPGATRTLGLQVHLYEVRAASELDAAFANAAQNGMQAMFVSQSPLFNVNRNAIAATTARLRLPAAYGFREFAEAGGLMAYGPSLPDMYRRSAAIADKILKGADPATLPIEYPTRFELVVNLKTARAIGLKISDAFLLSADEVIE